MGKTKEFLLVKNVLKRGGPLFLMLFSLCFSACSTVDPGQVDVELPESQPEMKVTSYTTALGDLGLMTEIYDTGSLKIQSNPIGDNTGTAGATGGEIPRDITEMIKSSLNSIGGNVLFIPYDPAFIQNQMVTGYSNFDQKLIPDVVISGGITEFDRGLETRGTNTDVGAEASFTNAPSWAPSKSVSIDYGAAAKAGLARITLDFNLLDFKTMAGIPRMNTVNSMEVSKALSEQEFGITLFGPTFGRKGSIKKVQGRHAAVRLLVEASMLQVVGKYLVLPYWRLLGEGSSPDKVVLSALSKSYYRMTEEQRIAGVQEWLFLHGYDVPITAYLDDETLAALQQFDSNFNPQSQTVDEDTFINIYTTIPIEEKTLGRRQLLARAYAQQAPQPVESEQNVQESQPQVESEPESVSQSAAVSESVQPTPESSPVPSKKGRSVGRMLTDEDW